MRIPRLISKTVSNNILHLQFETGENRYFIIEDLLEELNLTEVAAFSMADIKGTIIEEGVLVFPSISITLPSSKGKIKKPYDLDPEYLYRQSMSLEQSIGDIFRTIRKSKNLSIEAVAERCHTDKAYISKFENNKIQGEWNSIRRLFFLGLQITLNPAQLVNSNYRRYGSTWVAQAELLTTESRQYKSTERRPGLPGISWELRKTVVQPGDALTASKKRKQKPGKDD